MPWCEDCAKYWTPSAMREDGSCPSCGTRVAAQQPITAKNLDLHRLAAGEGADPSTARAPWHFKLLMLMVGAYLGWRIVQLFV